MCRWNNGVEVEVLLQHLWRDIAEKLQPFVLAHAFLGAMETQKHDMKPCDKRWLAVSPNDALMRGGEGKLTKELQMTVRET